MEVGVANKGYAVGLTSIQHRRQTVATCNVPLGQTRVGCDVAFG